LQAELRPLETRVAELRDSVPVARRAASEAVKASDRSRDGATMAARLKMLQGLPPLHVFVLGAPASGKENLCHGLCRSFQMDHVTVASVVREAGESGTMLGQQANSFMNRMGTVPDDLLVPLVVRALRAKGQKAWVLDGFPSSVSQAQELAAAGLAPSCVISMDVSEDALLERCLARSMDPRTGKRDPAALLMAAMKKETEFTETKAGESVSCHRASPPQLIGAVT
jgi:adenylate kinase family enzyme